jgi:hypothetical protein
MVKAGNQFGGEAAPVYVVNNPFDTSMGVVWGRSRIHKFGSNAELGTDIEDIWTVGGIYDWAQSAVSLEAISDSADDAVEGTGARVITVQGLDNNFSEIEEDIALAGTVATSATTAEFIRINRAFVKTAGVYASTAAGGNAGTITIRTAGGGNTHCRILYRSDLATDFGVGQSQISRYTVPAGLTACIASYQMTVEALKVVTFWLWQRQRADNVSAAFAPKRLVQQFDGIDNRFTSSIVTPLGPFPEKTDLWWSGVTSTGINAKVSVDFEVIQVKDYDEL